MRGQNGINLVARMSLIEGLFGGAHISILNFFESWLKFSS